MNSAEDQAPRFSVLVPTHNQAGLLVLALRSILAQSLQDFEILVVADGCTDGTQDAVRAIGDKRIRLFDLPKAHGFGYANRNVALKEARGALIAFLAHDDLYLPDHLEIMDRIFHDPAVKWAYSRPVIVESDGACHPSSQNLDVPAHLDQFLRRVTTIPAGTVVYRRSCHERVGYWDESIRNAGDREFWARILRDAGWEGLRFAPEPTVLHFRAPWRDNLRRASSRTRERFKKPYPDPWPLAVDLGDNAVEQDVYLNRMLADPVGWTARFRRDVYAVLDGRLAAYDWKQNQKRKTRGKTRESDPRSGEGVVRRLRRRLGWD
jgi:glycosyltransferase involved in cell wall biosynthesis